MKRSTGCIITVLILMAVACCFVAAAAAAIGFVTDWGYDIDWSRPWEAFRDVNWEEPFAEARFTEEIEETYEVGESPDLEVDIFAGEVLVRAGEGDAIEVKVTKRASSETRLERIEVELSESGDQVKITAKVPRMTTSNLSVLVEVTAPAGTSLDIDTGAGEIDVQGIEGSMAIHSGAGDINVREAEGAARIDIGAGQIQYEGRPQGECKFDTGAGQIILRIPEDADVEVKLDVGVGDIDVRGLDISGEVSNTDVDGTIGDGSDGSIDAHTGAGNIELIGY